MRSVRTSRSRLGATAVAAAAASALALPAGASAAGFTAHIHLATHQPRVGSQPITVTATRGRQKLSGTVSYRFMAGGLTFTRPGGHFSHGVYHDRLKWPKGAIGKNVRLQVVVTTRYGTDYLNWWIKVRG